MPTSRSRQQEQQEYIRLAREYQEALPMEHYMEAYTQAFQRKITVSTLDPVTLDRPDIQLFNELLVQDRVGRGRKLVQVCPDNMVVLHDEKLVVDGSYDVPLQPARPFCVMEYVSKSSVRKDYEDNYIKYERDLKVPYYLLFYPDHEELNLFKRGRTKYASVKPNAAGRYAIPEMEIEVALLEQWVRYWFRGRLLPMPSEMQSEIDSMKIQLVTAQQQVDSTKSRLSEAEAEILRLREELDRIRSKGA